MFLFRIIINYKNTIKIPFFGFTKLIYIIKKRKIYYENKEEIIHNSK
mgnify:CR=1 FL=1